MLKSLIVFKEFGNRALPESKLSILDFISDYPQDEKNSLIDYLNSGVTRIAFMHMVNDVIDPNNMDIAPDAYVTDGEWEWSDDFSYYVRRYNLRLPKAFLNKARSSSWKVDRNTVRNIDFDSTGTYVKNWYVEV
jgi:hypothetical protein